MTTYVAGSGAPPWVKGRANVIALPIPRCITTLSFNMNKGKKEQMIAKAQHVTEKHLERFLSERSP